MKKILVINDLHIPFNRKDVLDVIEKNKSKIEAIIFGGDILDCFEISSFPKMHNYSITEELIQAKNFFDQVCQIVSKNVKLILIYGNHEKRWQTYLAKMKDKALYQFITPNVLSLLRDGFSIFTPDGEKNYEGNKRLEVINNWWINYKGVIVCHPSNYSSARCKNQMNACDFFMSKGENFNSVIVAHTHHQSFVWYKGKPCFESGCSCKEMEYSDCRTNVQFQDNGYIIVSLKKGAYGYDFNFNETEIKKY